MRLMTNTDRSRLPELDEEERVPVSECRVVRANLMLPKGTSREDVRQIMLRLYESEPTLLHWSTNVVES